MPSPPRSLTIPVALGVAALALTLMPRPARAELAVADSIEWIALDSDLVVRGRLVAVKAFPRDRQGYRWSRVTLRVGEMLRGAMPRSRQLVFSVREGAQRSRWAKLPGDVLVFLVWPSRVKDLPASLAQLPTVRRSRSYDGWPVLDLQKLPKAAALGRDFRLYKSGAALLAGLRKTLNSARLPAGKLKSVTVDAPFGSEVARALYGGSAVWLVLPLDATTVSAARRWLGEKGIHRRLDAVKVLRQVRSPAHRKLLRGLLADKDYYSTTRGAGHPKRCVYAVRKAARDALRAWGEHVGKVVIETSCPPPR